MPRFFLLPVICRICQLTESAPASAETWSAQHLGGHLVSMCTRLQGMGQRLRRGREDERTTCKECIASSCFIQIIQKFDSNRPHLDSWQWNVCPRSQLVALSFYPNFAARLVSETSSCHRHCVGFCHSVSIEVLIGRKMQILSILWANCRSEGPRIWQCPVG